MSRFVDIYLDPCVPGYPALASPRWSTEIVILDSGAEQANQQWANPLNKYTLPEAVRDMEVFNATRDHWLIMRGPAKTWPFRDPTDFASVPLEKMNTEPAISRLDQIVGTGNGVTKTWQLSKVYERGGEQYVRDITCPLVSSVLVAIDGVLQVAGYTISRPGGEITFTNPPAPGVLITWGGYFDTIVRFEGDDGFDGIVRSFQVSGFADLNLVEVRSC